MKPNVFISGRGECTLAVIYSWAEAIELPRDREAASKTALIAARYAQF
jgi:hypothetical protein